MNVEIDDLKKVSVKPGEVIVLSTDRRFREAELRGLIESLQGVFPDNKVMVLGSGMSIDVYQGNSPQQKPEQSIAHEPQSNAVQNCRSA